MDTIKAFSKAILFCGCAIVAAGPLHAETISQDGGVTVVRGADDAETAAQRQVSRGRSGVAVFRGESSSATAIQQPAAAAPVPTQILGGQNLWVYDAANSAVTACSLRYDYYGNRTVRCSTD